MNYDEEWLQEHTPEELADEVEELTNGQIRWLKYKAEEDAKQQVLDDAQEHSYNASTTEVWDSGIEVITSFKDLAEEKIGARTLEQYAKNSLGLEKNKVVVPEEVRKTCKAVQEEVNEKYGSHCEFGILFKGEWTEEGFKVRNDYVIPEQTASTAHISYDEDLKKYRDQGYTVNVHSHPWSGESASFSGTDDEHINSHFDVALLYGGKAETIVNGVISVEDEEGFKVQVSPEIQVGVEEENLPDVDVESVSTRTGSKSRKVTGNAPDYKGYKEAYNTYFR